MKVFLKTISILLLGSTLIFAADKDSKNTNKTQGDAVNQGQPADTIITPHMGDNIKAGRNIVYCMSFQLAWDALKNDLIKEDIRMENEPLLVRFLNKSVSSKNDVDKSSYIAMAGFGKDKIIEKIRKTFKAKFENSAPALDTKIKPNDIIVYAYLYKNLKFAKKFEKIEDGINFNNSNRPVGAFGIKKYSTAKKGLVSQIDILYYKNDDNFIIRLKPKSTGDEIILAKVKPGNTFFNTIENVKTKISSVKPSGLENGDSLKIPKFNFDIGHEYKELMNKQLKLKKIDFNGYIIAEAIQQIKFKLNEKGAVLKSAAKVLMMETALQEPKARNFIFDKPFLIYLKEKKSNYPYFAMWVENDELMEK